VTSNFAALIAEHGEGKSLQEALLAGLYSFTGEGWEQEDDITPSSPYGVLPRAANLLRARLH
jgi:hypothetical protein